MRASSRMPVTSRATSRSTAACRAPSTASPPPVDERWKSTSRTWKPSSERSSYSGSALQPFRPSSPPALPHPTNLRLPVSTVRVSDADLVARAVRGDAAAFGELVDRHRSAVERAARAALGSHADAEDAAQEAFLVAYQRLASFRGEASFKTWLL